VKATAGKTYFIKNIEVPAIVQTDVDFGDAKFIIDDTEAFDQRLQPVFLVQETRPVEVVTKKIPSLKIGQKNIGFAPGTPALINLYNDQKRHYIRQGGNQNNGDFQFDVIKVDANGDLDPAVPVNWDFDHVSKAELCPIDERTLTIQGGNFLTVANRAPSKYTSYKRNIQIGRSNVTLRNIRHEITGEGETGAPYNGFVNIGLCSNILLLILAFVVVIFVGHKLAKSDVRDEITNSGRINTRVFGVIYFLVRWVAPVAIALIFITNFIL